MTQQSIESVKHYIIQIAIKAMRSKGHQSISCAACFSLVNLTEPSINWCKILLSASMLEAPPRTTSFLFKILLLTFAFPPWSLKPSATHYCCEVTLSALKGGYKYKFLFLFLFLLLFLFLFLFLLNKHIAPFCTIKVSFAAWYILLYSNSDLE